MAQTKYEYKSNFKETTLKDIFLEYPHKKYPKNPSTVPKPYFPKTEQSDHKFAVSYNEWSKFFDIYFSLLLEYMLEGHEVRPRQRLGVFKMFRYKQNVEKRKLRYGEAAKRIAFEPYSPTLRWLRANNFASMKGKWYWSISFMEKASETLFRLIQRNPQLLYNLNNVIKHNKK